MSGLADFKQLGKLGDGAYSTVVKVTRVSDGQLYALKQVKLSHLSDKDRENALNEVRLLASISHPAIIAFKEAFLDEPSRTLCIVQEFADEGDLFQRITAQRGAKAYAPEVFFWNVFLGICGGLQALHSMNILHRDLKSANVFLFGNGQVKLGDLNVSKVARRGGLLLTQTGTPYYASPEVWMDSPYDEKSDMWSLGCVLFETATLRPPFRAENMDGLYRKVTRGVYPRIPACFSQQVADVIAWLLRVNPRERPTVSELLARLDVAAVAPQGRAHLLKTIKLPKNPSELQKLLPPSRYVRAVK